MSRELTSHKVNGCNNELTIGTVDEPGIGGAHHEYFICVPNGDPGDVRIKFQNGPIKEVGTNGVTHEALLAIVIDRLEGFQSGPYECEENQDALNYLRKAQEVLHDRTLARLARGVEGTHEK